MQHKLNSLGHCWDLVYKIVEPKEYEYKGTTESIKHNGRQK
jgi:hypothetical protein